MITMNQASARRLTQAAVAGSAMIALSTGIALAWHPNGVITKGVTNVTAGATAVSAADTLSTAVSAKPGDTLKYTITIKNDSPTSNSYDDLGFTKLTDTLPAGVELISGKLTEDLGTVKAKQSVTRVITVKVKASVTNGTVLENKACFTGAATNNEAGTQQTRCDIAIVKVTVVPPTPTPTPTPVPTPVPTPDPTPTPTPGVTLGTSTVAPAALPAVGGSELSAALGFTAMVSTAAAYIKSRRK